MNMVPSLSAMEERIIMAKNVIAIIVVCFLIVSTFVFSHCKDRPYSRTLQDFSTLFASDIATRWPNRDNPCHPIQNLSPRYQESSKNRRYTKRRWKMCFRSRPIDFINCKLIKLIIDKVDKVDKIDFFSLKH